MTGRFAPTPSGRMHIGNMTAMLAAWLDSRARDQRMLLRIEDIDTPRVLPDADRWIMDDLDWLGLDWDGDPVYQSQRIDLYEQALRLLESHTAAPHGPRESVSREMDATCIPLIYPCFCSRTDIRAASAPQEGDGFQIYPGTCRRLARERPHEVRERLARGDRHSLRIAMPGASAGTVEFDDAVFGPQSFELAREIGDSVIRRSDGLFGYQFVVTVDDLATGVDSIVRGRDLLRSTALQTYIRERLIAGGWDFAFPSHDIAMPYDTGAAAHRSSSFSGEGTVSRRLTGGKTTRAQSTQSAPQSAEILSPARPTYAHIPLIDNAAGKRLAKRERSLDMGALRARGVTAEQVTGVCAWLLRLVDDPEPCAARDLLDMFRTNGWAPLRADHADRRLDPADPHMPDWLAAAL